MALINTNRQWIYLLEPHTASRSTSIALQKLGFISVGGWHAKLAPLHEAGMIPDPTDYEVGVTVRNPIDVLITKWLKGRPKKISLWDWMRETDPVYFRHPLMGLWKTGTTFCWFEHLTEDLQYVFNNPTITVDFDPTHKCREDASLAKRPWWKYVQEDHRVLDKALRMYGDFMKVFGYHYAEWNGRPHMFIDEDTRNKLRRQIR